MHSGADSSEGSIERDRIRFNREFDSVLNECAKIMDFSGLEQDELGLKEELIYRLKQLFVLRSTQTDQRRDLLCQIINYCLVLASRE